MIEGLSHLTFIVRDLDKMEEILTKVLDARKIYDSGDQSFSLSKESFLIFLEFGWQLWRARLCPRKPIII